MKIKITKEQMKMVGEFAVKIGKQVIIQGTKAVIFQAVGVGAMKFVHEGTAGVKTLKVDDYLGEDAPTGVQKIKKLKKKVTYK